MSLDVILIRKVWKSYDEGKTHTVEEEVIYDSNITHNLTGMAEAAGIYDALWRPYKLVGGYNISEEDRDAEWDFEDNTNVFAKDISPILEAGVKKLNLDPKYYKTFDSSNGWGVYENFVPFVEKYLEKCKEYPDAIVRVSR